MQQQNKTKNNSRETERAGAVVCLAREVTIEEALE